MDYPKTVPNVNLRAGQFTDGDPSNGVPASLDPAEWANAVTEEVLNVLSAAGISPVENTNNQLLAAIQAIITARFTGSNQLLAPSGYQRLPGGLIFQWGAITVANVANTNVSYTWTYPIAFPSSAFAAFGVARDNDNGLPNISCEGFGSNATLTGFTKSNDTIARVYSLFAIGF